MTKRHLLLAATLISVLFAATIPATPADAANISYERIDVTGPDWYTSEFEQRVAQAGAEGVRLPDNAAFPGGISVPAAIGITRPGIGTGQWLLTLLGSDGSDSTAGWCTANFVFASSGRYGLGTAGHCGTAGQRVSALVVPPVGSGKLPGVFQIGTIKISRDNGIGDDFAVIEIDAAYQGWMNATMPYWCGPTGAYTGNTALSVAHFGYGTAVGTGGTPRAGVVLRWDAEGGTAFSWASPAAPGDSGSGVVVLDVTGRPAAGNLTHLAVDAAGNVIGVAGTRIAKMLSIADSWTLVNGAVSPPC